MLVCSIKEKNLLEIEKKIKKINKDHLIELRLDGLESLQIEELKKFKNEISNNIIFTLRAKEQLGDYKRSEKERLDDIEKLLTLEPEYFDIECDINKNRLEKWQKNHPKTKFILSYHSLSFPKDLDTLLEEMIKKDVYSYKIAVLPSSFEDLHRLYDFAKKANKNRRLTLIALGKKFFFFRLFRLGNFFDYVGAIKPTAPGQLTYNEALSLYRLLEMDENTKFYSLIGHPLDRSISHIYYNELFQKERTKRVYVKIPVLKDELASFMEFAKKTFFYGFSITMPLKEAAVQYADEKDINLPINTLVKKKDRWVGYNTDVMAVKDLIEDVSNKKVAILGGGAAAKAIALTLKKEKAKITLLVRNIEKIKPFAEKNDFSYFLLNEKVKDKFDVLINTIPITDKIIIDSCLIHPQMYVMDIVWAENTQTALLALAKEKGCKICDALTFFLSQAKYQLEIFLDESKDGIYIDKQMNT